MPGRVCKIPGLDMDCICEAFPDLSGRGSYLGGYRDHDYLNLYFQN
jgi:hypothetical protein